MASRIDISSNVLDEESSDSVSAPAFVPRASTRLLIQALLARGLDTFFTAPGRRGEITETICRIPDIRIAPSRDETHAVVAALLYHRACARVPVVIVESRSGGMNAMAGIAAASRNGVPMLVIVSGSVAAGTPRTGERSILEEMDLASIYAPIVRSTIRPVRSRDVIAQVSSALEAATDSHNPGPVLLILPCIPPKPSASQSSPRASTNQSAVDKTFRTKESRDVTQALRRLFAEIKRVVGPSARFITDIDNGIPGLPEECYSVATVAQDVSSGIAGSIGLALADKSRRVVCILREERMYTAGEEAITAVRQALPILFVVMKGSGSSQVTPAMERGEDTAPDWLAFDVAIWAESFGMPALIAPLSEPMTTDVIRSLLAGDGPALIDARFEDIAGVL